MRSSAPRGSLGAGLLLAMVGCVDSSTSGAAPASRFDAVKAAPGSAAAAQVAHPFCDRIFPVDGPQARRFSAPSLKQVSVAPDASPGHWRWVNVWATWCGPCKEELPLLKRWGEALRADGLPVDFDFISVVGDEAALQSFDRARLPGSVHWLEDYAQLGSLLTAAGVAADSAIPVHALVDPQGRLRCARGGSVTEAAYGAVKRFLAEGR